MSQGCHSNLFLTDHAGFPVLPSSPSFTHFRCHFQSAYFYFSYRFLWTFLIISLFISCILVLSILIPLSVRHFGSTPVVFKCAIQMKWPDLTYSSKTRLKNYKTQKSVVTWGVLWLAETRHKLFSICCIFITNNMNIKQVWFEFLNDLVLHLVSAAEIRTNKELQLLN